MDNKIFFELYSKIPRQGPGSRESTLKALSTMQVPEYANLIDLGCGTSSQTMVLAENTSANIIAVDMHGPYIEELSKKITEAGFSGRVKAVQGDMGNLEYKENSFDVIWCEAAIYNVGFEHGIKYLKKFLKPGGFFAVSELAWIKKNPPHELREYWKKEYPQIKEKQLNKDIIKQAGYDILDQFILPENDWRQYYDPLVVRAEFMLEKYKGHEEATAIINETIKENEIFVRFSEYYGYMFYILKSVS